MTAPENIRTEIMEQIADLSKLLGMMPSDDTITISEPVTLNSMALSEWLNEARNSFLKLSALIGTALDLNLQ